LDKAKFYIENLKLAPHPEGGYFKEVYRSGEIISKESLPQRYEGSRSVSTSIYFLLDGDNISAFHKLKSDEIWHHYDGDAVRIFILSETGELNEKILGKDILNNQSLQVTITRNNWFAAELLNKKSFALFGCTVAPGFAFEDFQLAGKEEMLNRFPEHKTIINKMAR
jgi:uncharacterized protein